MHAEIWGPEINDSAYSVQSAVADPGCGEGDEERQGFNKGVSKGSPSLNGPHAGEDGSGLIFSQARMDD